jgi:hypothetical protein
VISERQTRDNARRDWKTVSLMPDEIARLISEAEAQGYKRETCQKCQAVFEPHIHFIRCTASACPMTTGKTLLDYLEEATPCP